MLFIGVCYNLNFWKISLFADIDDDDDDKLLHDFCCKKGLITVRETLFMLINNKM